MLPLVNQPLDINRGVKKRQIRPHWPTVSHLGDEHEAQLILFHAERHKLSRDTRDTRVRCREKMDA